jgi:hypothetical protein
MAKFETQIASNTQCTIVAQCNIESREAGLSGVAIKGNLRELLHSDGRSQFHNLLLESLREARRVLIKDADVAIED